MDESHRRKIIYRKAKLVAQYVQSAVLSLRHRSSFDGVEAFCMFVGYPRSGHSLVGSLLDAHPDIVIAHEQDALRYLRVGFTKAQLYTLLLKNAADFATEGRQWTGYSYEVPGQWQGKVRKLRIIGDKQGGRSTRRFYSNPAYFDLLTDKLDVPIKFVHVIRNPFDNIAARYVRNDNNSTLKDTMESSLQMYKGMEAVKQRVRRESNFEILDIHQEDLVSDSLGSIRRLFKFTSVGFSEQLIQDCASIIYCSPHKRRFEVEWNKGLMDRINNEIIGRFDFLRSYCF